MTSISKKRTQEFGDERATKKSKTEVDYATSNTLLPLPCALEQEPVVQPIIEEPGVPCATLRKHLECGQCHKLLLKPLSLKCSHTFCAHCINKHLKKNKCCPNPDCGAIVLRKPYYNRLVDSLVEKCEQKLSVEELKTRNDYKNELEEAQKNAILRFQAKSEELKAKGTRMLNILDKWEVREKEVFRVGYDKYDGDFRVAYCAEVGFNKEIVDTATDEMTTIMLNNLGVEVPRYISVEPVKYDYEMGRAILIDILFG
jgi:hypothetical protein